MDVSVPAGMDYAEIGVAFVVYFVLSFLWWGPLFGKRWAALMGFDPTVRQPMAKAMLLQVLGTFLLSYVLFHVLEGMVATHDDSGGLMRGDLSVTHGLLGGVVMWAGFFLPVQLGRLGWERAPFALFAINAGGQLLCLMAMGLTFALM
jgi:hypothetical protein